MVHKHCSLLAVSYKTHELNSKIYRWIQLSQDANFELITFSSIPGNEASQSSSVYCVAAKNDVPDGIGVCGRKLHCDTLLQLLLSGQG